MSADKPIQIVNLSSTTKFNKKGHKDLPELPFFLICAGPSRSGKSNCIKNLLQRRDLMKKLFRPEDIFIISPSLRFNDDYEEVDTPNKFDEFTNQLVKEIVNEQTLVIDTYKKSRAPHILLVLDDIADNPQFANSRILQQLAFRGRHCKISVIVSVQKLSSIPRGVRLNSTHFSLFRPSNMSELDNIIEELCPKHLRKKMYGVFNEIWTQPYSFVYMDLLNKDMKKRVNDGFSNPMDFNFLENPK